MVTIVTRAGKGSPLTNTEMDTNLTNLNTGKAEWVGGTFTGSCTFTNGGVGGGNMSVNVDAGSGFSKYFRVSVSGTTRWGMGGDSTAEGGSNSGTDFFINGYSDTGSLLNTYLKIVRASGAVSVPGSFSAGSLSTNGGGALNGAFTFNTRPTFNGNTPYDSGNLPGTSITWTNTQYFTNGGLNGGNVNPSLSAAAGSYRYVQYLTNNVVRWVEGVDNLAEGGANAGSNWFLNRYDDSGALLGASLTINRASGNITFNGGTLSMSSNRIINVADPTSAQDVVTQNFLTNNLFGWRNRIINGECRVQQRVLTAAGTVSTTGQNTYGPVDRFLTTIGNAGGTATISANTITTSGVARPCVVVTANSAPTNLTGANWWYGIAQIIEGLNAYDLIGKQITLSFLFNATVAGTYAVAIRDSTNSYSFVTTFSYTTGNTPQRITITTPAIPTAANIPANTSAGLHVSVGNLNTGTYQSASGNNGVWQTGNFITLPGVVNWAATAGNFIAMAEIQLEAGAIATPFERRPFAVEYQLCQYYFVAYANAAFAVSGDTQSMRTQNMTGKMRVSPSIVTNCTDANFANGSVPSGSQWYFVRVGVTYPSRTGTITIGGSGGGAQGVGLSFYGMNLSVLPNEFGLGGSLYVAFNAEF